MVKFLCSYKNLLTDIMYKRTMFEQINKYLLQSNSSKNNTNYFSVCNIFSNNVNKTRKKMYKYTMFVKLWNK